MNRNKRVAKDTYVGRHGVFHFGNTCYVPHGRIAEGACHFRAHVRTRLF